MPSWLQQAWSRGIVTTRYPREAATPAEAPETAYPPVPTEGPTGLLTAAESCPTSAIRPDAIDQGRCIRCARCGTAGLAFTGPLESSRTHRSDLVWPGGAPAPASREQPLAVLGRSVHVFLVDVGSCNACNLEVLSLANPYYDSQRLGIFLTNSPRHADLLVVVGVPTEEMVDPLRRAFEAMPAPKAVVAVGVCPTSGGIFAGSPGVRASLEEVVPVNLYVPGCPPPPVAVLDGILTVMGRQRLRPGGP